MGWRPRAKHMRLGLACCARALLERPSWLAGEVWLLQSVHHSRSSHDMPADRYCIPHEVEELTTKRCRTDGQREQYAPR